MQNWRQITKQLDGANDTPSINAVAVFQAKKNLDTKIVFNRYDYETRLQSFVEEPIKGILVDYSFKVESYNENYKCSLQSSAYFQKNQQVRVYCTDKNSDLNHDARNFRGNADQAKEFIRNINGKLSVNAILIVATDKGVIEVKTNAILFLAQFPFVDKHRTDYLVSFEPKLYDPTTIKIHGKLPENYASLPPDRYPIYTNISLTNLNILARTEETHNIQKVCEDVLAWKKWLAEVVPETLKSNQSLVKLPQPSNTPLNHARVAVPTFPELAQSDDLPF